MCPQTPYDYNMRTTQGYSMIVLAAEYGRHDVLQYLLDSLSKTFEGDSRVNILIEQEVQATRVCDCAWSTCGKMKDTLKVPTLQVCMV